jgi:protein SCO1
MPKSRENAFPVGHRIRRAGRRPAPEALSRGAGWRRGRRRTAVAVVAVALAVLATGCSSGGGGKGGGSAIPAPSQDIGTRMSGAVPADILHLPLTDSTGKRTSLAAFKGKVLVISDVMTLCQETCPLDTANLVQTARQAVKDGEGSKVEFLSITIDPQRDNTAQLAAYRKLFSPAPADWQTLTGSSSAVAKLWKYFGVWYKKVPQGKPPAKNWRTGQTLTYDLDHADELLFVDGRGSERFLISGTGHVAPGTSVPAAMRKYLDADGLKNLKDPDAQDWTVGQALQTVGWLLQHKLAGSSST